jgi:hypothetical protein
VEDEAGGILHGEAMSWNKEAREIKEPFAVLLHGVRTLSPDAFEIDVEWSFQEQWGMPAESERAWYVVTKRTYPELPRVKGLHAELPQRLALGQGVLVRVAGIVQERLEAGESVSFPIDIAHDDGKGFIDD